MRIIRGIKVGGLQQKLFNLMLVFILALVAAYAAVSIWQQRNLSKLVQEANARQQESIVTVSGQTMENVLSEAMTQNAALQAHIADEVFGDVRTDVLTLKKLAEALFAHADSFSIRPVFPPDKANDGIVSAMLLHEPGVSPESSEALGLLANMRETMEAMFASSDKLSGCYAATADGNLLFVNDRAASYVSQDGTPVTLDVRSRPWYIRAAEAGRLVFTGVETDAYTGFPTLECAAPVYRNGELVAVVGADIFLTSIRDYVERFAGGDVFLCVINENGQVLFSSDQNGIFRAEHSAAAPDLRKSGNRELALFVEKALRENTGLTELAIDGTAYYMAGAPMPSAGWTVVSAVDQELTRRPAEEMLEQYDAISAGAREIYAQGARRSILTVCILTAAIILLALGGALVLAARTVKPLEKMTKRINALRNGDIAFEMEDSYRTGDEIEILAESFATLSQRTRNYIEQIRRITAEKERIGTELALATRIQADMLPNIFPAFPDRQDFDIYASMTPAKEVGGDFYDFFLIDETHLGLVMADVSGKGVPAALFMMIAKTLVQNNAVTGSSPAEVLRAVNEQICANNREEMFVTVWFGVLDTRTGIITAANAGHEYPALMPAGGQFALVEDRHGFVLGGMPGMRYREYMLELKPGAKLFLYTDGVAEATSAGQELFGTERMLSALNTVTAAPPEAVLKQVRAAVDGFVKDAEQFDDLTMLCLEYKGNTGNQ